MATRTRAMSGPRLLGLFLVVLLQTPAHSQDVAYGPVRLAGQDAPKKDLIGNIQASSADCGRCHNGYKSEGIPPAAAAMKSNEFILHNESVTWFASDVHSIAYTNLTKPLATEMGKKLGYDVSKAPQCLTCHSADMSPQKPLKEKKIEDFATADGGVNCTVCHGLGERWQIDHTRAPVAVGGALPWREKDPQYKYDRGMADLRNPAVKAKLCVSCHVGNPDEGKIITHDMYAAGHPPIPPFELAHYMDAEPKHWGFPTDPKLPYFQQFAEKSKGDESWKIFRYNTADKESYLARHVVAGAVAAMEAEAALLAHAAKETQSGGFDYARFDCYSCHHDLNYPSARQKRGYEGAPGRVPLKVWNGALPEVIAMHAATHEDAKLKAWGAGYKEGWPKLRLAAVARQLGDPAAVTAAAATTRKWCNDYLQHQTDTAAPIYSPAHTKELLKLINSAATNERWIGDTEAALSLTWASLSLRGDLKMALTKEQLAELNETIITKIRWEPYSDGMKPAQPIPIVANLDKRLTQFAMFRPEKFVIAFKKLNE